MGQVKKLTPPLPYPYPSPRNRHHGPHGAYKRGFSARRRETSVPGISQWDKGPQNDRNARNASQSAIAGDSGI